MDDNLPEIIAAQMLLIILFDYVHFISILSLKLNGDALKWINILHKMYLIKEYSDIYEINYYKETIKIRTKTHLQLFWTVIMQELHSYTLAWIRQGNKYNR